MHGGQSDGETGIDNSWAEKSFENVGSWILGRNMFSPVRGPWPDESWKGWWGDEPPYHCQVFVLTHYARPTLRMKGGTDFLFVTGGIHEALARAKEAAAGRDVRIGGGVATVRQYLQARLIDELHLAQRPVRPGRAPVSRSRPARTGLRGGGRGRRRTRHAPDAASRSLGLGASPSDRRFDPFQFHRDDERII
jgi:dihydrofolate reductase